MRGIRGAAALGLVLLLSACQTAPLLRPLPAGDPRPDALLARFRSDVEGRVALRGSARLAVDSQADGESAPLHVRSKQRLVLARPARLRVEVQGLLGATLAVLAVDDDRYAWFESETRHFESGPVYDALLWHLVRLDLTPAQAVEVLLGAPDLGPDPRVAGAWDAGDGVVRIALAGPRGGPPRAIDLDRQARLRRFAVLGGGSGADWKADFDDLVEVGGAPLARRVTVETASGTRAVLTLSDVELNPPLAPDIFRIDRVASEAGSEGEGG